MDCGPTCIRMIAKYHGHPIRRETLRSLAETTTAGSSLMGIADAAERIGFKSLGVKITFQQLQEDVELPCILHWNQDHFVVVTRIKGNRVWIADPAKGMVKMDKEEFLKYWGVHAEGDLEPQGIALLLEATHRLGSYEEADESRSQEGMRFLIPYVLRYKRFIFQLVIGLLVGSFIQLAFPFLTQSIIDIGIQQQDIDFVYLVLLAQLMLFIGKAGVEVIRGWILLHISTRINISLLSVFFLKLMNLPIAFFDNKMTGDLLQRIQDNKRMESLLTTTSLSVLFSIVSLVVFGSVLAWYNGLIFLLFLLGSGLYVGWITVFLRKRKKLDFRRFDLMSEESSKVIELINGMQEIKLHNAEKRHRWAWERIQARLFKVQVSSLALEQTQTIGSSSLNEIKKILITIVSAKLVIDGELTLGMMLSIATIIGQLDAPIAQIVDFIYKFQDAKIAMERLSEIHNREDEEGEGRALHSANGDIRLEKISFRYPGTKEPVIKDLSLTIPKNKVTAIVGASGSGKTTLLKILLKYYRPQSGAIKIGQRDLRSVSHHAWRDKCGSVMQEGFIFNDSIARNIAVGQEQVDFEGLLRATQIANIRDFVERLPQGFHTKIGVEGVGTSTGQKQRILIARAVYKNPELILFDEATSALDAQNEREIMEHMGRFFQNRTAVVIAHRLSTVKHADQIVVLEEGRIIEQGNHMELLDRRGRYYALVKNQLELERLHA